MVAHLQTAVGSSRLVGGGNSHSDLQWLEKCESGAIEGKKLKIEGVARGDVPTKSVVPAA